MDLVIDMPLNWNGAAGFNLALPTARAGCYAAAPASSTTASPVLIHLPA